MLTMLPATAVAGSMQGGQPVRPPLLTSTADCRRTLPSYADREGQPLRPHKLAELPPAHGYSAVFRQIGGCEAPIVIKYRVGGQ
jgi:hypothetical protein